MLTILPFLAFLAFLDDPRMAGAAIAVGLSFLFGRSRRKLPAAATAGVAGYALGALAPSAVTAVTEKLRPAVVAAGPKPATGERVKG